MPGFTVTRRGVAEGHGERLSPGQLPASARSLSSAYKFPETFGAVGDGVADDTAAVVAAIAAATAAGVTVYFDKVFKVTSSIAAWHGTVPFRGPGGVIRGTDTFRVEPTTFSTNTLYVSPTGSDANDGLTAALPVQTLQHAFDLLRFWGPILRGRWQITLAAGTYTQGAVYDATFDQPAEIHQLIIQGPDQAGGTPTAILDGTSATTTHGLAFYGSRVNVWINSFKVQNFSSTTSAGVYQEAGPQLSYTDCHFVNCGYGIHPNARSSGLVRGACVFDTCTRGIYIKNASTGGAILKPTGTPLVKNCVYGVVVSENASVHLTDLVIQDCTTRGMEVSLNSRVICDSDVSFLRNVEAVLVDGSAHFEDNGVIWNDGGVDANPIKYRYRVFGEAKMPLGLGGDAKTNAIYLSERILVVDPTSSTTHSTRTFFASNTASQRFAIPPNTINHFGKRLRARIVGTITGVVNTKTLTLAVDGVTYATKTFIAAQTGDFELEVDLIHTGATNSNTQAVVARSIIGTTYAIANSTAALALGGGSTYLPLTVSGTVADGSDGITVSLVEVAEV